MMYNLVDKFDPILRKKTDKFDFHNPPMDPVELYSILGNKMVEEGGIGLAAPQIGLPYRAFVLRAESIIGVFNPIIVDQSKEEIELEEGCLSYPGIFLNIKRPRTIKVRYTLPNAEIVTKKYDGITARAFLHEYDHLEGVVFTSKVNRFYYEKAKKIMKRMKETKND